MDQVIKNNVKTRHFFATRLCFAGCGAIIGRGSCDAAHVVPESSGGPCTAANLRATCIYCNRSSHNENLFDYMRRNRLEPPVYDAEFAAHKYGGDMIEPLRLEPRDIREVVTARARIGGPVGIISAATGCGKTSLAMEIIGRHICGRLLLWITEMNVVVASQFTRRNILGWKAAGLVPAVTTYLFNSHIKYCDEFPPTCIIACTHATARQYHHKVTADPRFVGYVIDECHDEVNGPVTLEWLREIAPRSTVRLGLTATPRRETAAGALFSADFGAAPTYLLEYSVFEALRDGHIRFPECKFARVVASGTGPAGADTLVVDGAVCRNIMAVVLASPTRKGIIWADNIESARELHAAVAEDMRAAGIRLLIDNSKVKTEKSERIGKIFRETPANCVIIACERYRAGVDIRGLSFGIICGRNRRDIAVIMQCLGRLTRLEPFPAVFAEFNVTDSPEEYRAALRARILDFYGRMSRWRDIELTYRGGKLALAGRGDESAAPPIYFSMLEGVEICELARFTADEMMAELRTRLGFAIDDEYLRRVFTAAGVKTVAEIEAFLEQGCGGCSELARWWNIMRYLSSGVNWNRVLGVVGDFYPDAATARRAVNELLRVVDIDETSTVGAIYEQLRGIDKKLPPNPVTHYGIGSMRELVNLE